MKKKFTLKINAVLACFCCASYPHLFVFFIACLFLVLPFLGFIYINKIYGTILGIIITACLFYAGKKVYKAIKNKKGKALLVHMANMIVAENFAMSFTVLIVLVVLKFIGTLGSLFIFFPFVPLYLSIIYFYVCIVLISIPFGIALSFGETDLEQVLISYEKKINGSCTGEDRKSWKKERKKLIYFNPITMPFSAIIFPLYYAMRFIFKFFSLYRCSLEKEYENHITTS